jgi:hypothetical protein
MRIIGATPSMPIFVIKSTCLEPGSGQAGANPFEPLELPATTISPAVVTARPATRSSLTPPKYVGSHVYHLGRLARGSPLEDPSWRCSRRDRACHLSLPGIVPGPRLYTLARQSNRSSTEAVNQVESSFETNAAGMTAGRPRDATFQPAAGRRPSPGRSGRISLPFSTRTPVYGSLALSRFPSRSA